MPKSIHRPEAHILIDLLREQRLAAGYTQTDLSDRLKRVQSFVSDVERGHRRLDLVQLRDYAQALNRSLTDLVREFDRRVERSVREHRRR